MESFHSNPCIAVRVNIDQLCRNLTLRLGMPVQRDRAARWLRAERFEPVEDVWVCQREALDALEPDEVEIIGPWSGASE